MRLFKISKNNKDYILSAQDKVDAVRKLRDAQNKSCDESLDEKERKAQEWVDYDIKHYGKVSETTKEEIRKMGLDFDKWDNQVKDSVIKDSNFDIVKNAFNKYGVDIIKVVNRQDGSKAIYFDKKDKDIYNKPEIMNLYRSGKLRYAGSGYFVEVLDSSTIKDASIDTKHYAEYGWTIEDSLARNCYWEAVEQLAGKLKTEQDYIREIPKLAKQLFEKYVKEIKNEFEKLISAGRSNTSYFEKWVPEQAKNIVAKQGK